MQVMVTILGFGEFERDALSFCIRHAPSIDVQYLLCDSIDAADLIVADADAGGVIDRIVHAARTPHVVFVGRTEVPGAVCRVPRPIEPTRVLRCLDDMAAEVARERLAGWTGPAALQAQASVHSAAVARTQPGGLPPIEPTIPGGLRDMNGTLAGEMSTSTARIYALPTELPPELPVLTRPPEPDPRISTKARVRRAVRRAQRAVAAGASLPTDVLVLEENPHDVATLADLLQRFGFTVHAAGRTADAFERLKERAYAAAFVCIALDGSDRGDGIELCRRIKEVDSAIALIVVSARPDASDHVRARLAGADVHLTKPLSRGDVARSLEDCGVGLPADARRA